MKTTLLASMMLLLASCGGGLEVDEPATPADTSGSVTSELKAARTSTSAYALRTTDAQGSAFKTSYPAYSTYDIFFATDLPGSVATRGTVTVYAVLPNGSTYQRFDVSYATTVQAGAGEQQAEKTASGWRVWTSMPVAGTMIDLNHLTGAWTARAHVNGSTRPNASTGFDIF